MTTGRRGLLLNEVLSLNAQELYSDQCRSPFFPILNEVLSLNAQESDMPAALVNIVGSSMKS